MIFSPFNNIPPLPIGLPPGSVVAFAGKVVQEPSSPPQNFETVIEKWGWMVCDGRSLPISGYPYLFEVIGHLYAQSGDDISADASGAMFRLPNYQGYFLRMVDPSGIVDKDNSDRQLTDGTKSPGVGSIQEDALQTHQHTYNEPENAGPGDTGSAFATVMSQLTGPPTSSMEGGNGNVKVSQNETRSVNMAIYYIIKFL